MSKVKEYSNHNWSLLGHISKTHKRQYIVVIMFIFLTSCSPKSVFYQSSNYYNNPSITLYPLDSTYNLLFPNFWAPYYTSKGKYIKIGEDSIHFISEYTNYLDSLEFKVVESNDTMRDNYLFILPNEDYGITFLRNTHFVGSKADSVIVKYGKTFVYTKPDSAFAKHGNKELLISINRNTLPFFLNDVIYNYYDFGKTNVFTHRISNNTANTFKIIPTSKIPPKNFLILNNRAKYSKMEIEFFLGGNEPTLFIRE